MAKRRGEQSARICGELRRASRWHKHAGTICYDGLDALSIEKLINEFHYLLMGVTPLGRDGYVSAVEPSCCRYFSNLSSPSAVTTATFPRQGNAQSAFKVLPKTRKHAAGGYREFSEATVHWLKRRGGNAV